ncbi:hypothetical protein QYE76_007026 [Lolium multiflorum]|uniref:Uncharacterized protein n=1 Tax=Lolium multiflorum TaxID=4521 RepID=A0AAD8RZD7_LOLMU|nr:hypothetical protein QYE76_007026 [Lolium multiflorum]
MVQDELTVRRGTPSLVAPARETPRESKPLSDLDDQNCMRIYLVGIYAFRGNASKQGVDPAVVVRGALAEALVHYYPLAGRLREEAGRKLVVDCAGQGVAFVEADANMALDDLGEVRYPPFPRSEEFVYDDHVYMANLPPGLLLPEIIGQPLLYVQVTRFMCGGFIVGTRTCHCLTDGSGVAQFLKSVGELARGADSPSVPPVWSRDIFNAREPPCPSFPHPEFQEPAGGDDRLMYTPPHELERVEFSFGPEAIAALHSRAAPGKPASRFDLVAACLWRSRTAALGYAPGDEVRCGMPVDARGKRPADFGREIPKGFYGNAIACTVACCTAEELCGRDLGYAVGLVREAKATVTYEYMQSLADRMVLEGRPVPEAKRTFTVSDLSNVGLEDVDFGWGNAVYGGPPMNALYQLPGGATFFRRRKNGSGEEETYGAIYLPKDCVARYMKEVEALTTTITETALRARY